MKRFRLTPMQEVMLYESMNDPSRYVTVLRYRLQKPIAPEALDQRLRLLAQRHEGLRTAFVCDETGVFWSEITDHIDDTLFKLEPHGCELRVTFHHALLDGWSVGILMRELISEDAPSGSATPFRYYAKWIEKQGGNLDWWNAYLGGEGVCPALPHVRKTEEYERRERRFALEKSGLLRETARELGTTAGRLIQAVWCMLVARYNGGKSIVCTVTAGRGVPVPGIVGMVGMCVNTLPIVTELPPPPESMAFSDWLHRWSRRAAEAEKQGVCRLGELLAGPMPHLLSIDPPFDGERYRFISSSARLVTDFDAVFTLGETITAEFAYNACAYSDEAASAIEGHFLTALHAVLEAPQIPLERIPILTEVERAELTAPNEAAESLRIIGQRTVVDFWRESAERHANRTALVCGDVRRTYAEVSAEAEGLARALGARGVGREAPVAILLPRSERYVIAELAVLLAGGLFVPLDPEWPRDRIQSILAEIRPVLVIDGETDRALRSGPCAPPVAPSCQPHDAAYVIMTSGTTGVPKGVVVAHRSLAHFCLWARERYGWKPGDSSALELGFSFDGSFWSIWPPLLSGGTVHILRDEVRFDIGALGAYCRRERITHLDLPVAMTEVFREKYGAENALPDLRVMVTGGEEVRRVTPAPYPLSNEYGPTECTVCCCAAWLGSGQITLGKPVENMTVYLLDEWGRLCPDGVIGEAYFSGVQVARGYYNAPELTKERFVKNPFADGEIMYKTGDLMVRNQCRALVFAGRTDDQVKINGFRIELAEIENVLRSHGAVSAAAAFVRDGTLCAYAVGEVDVSELSALMAAKLPPYMRPAITMTDRIPLTANGKVDFGQISSAAAEQPALVKAPVTESERILLSAVSKALNVNNIGTNHNYLELGGNSINAMRISFSLEKEGYALSAKQLIRAASLGAAAAELRLSEPGGAIEAGADTFIPLAAQQAMLFLSKTAGPHMYAVTTTATAAGLEEETLKQRLDQAVLTHDILRTSFEIDETGQICGRVGGTLHPSIRCDLRDGELILRYHHIALDGHSVNLLMQELLSGEFPESAPSFAAFANRLAARTGQQAEDAAWWRARFREAKTVPLLPAKPDGTPEFRRVTACGAELLASCAQAAQTARVTLAAFTLTAWSVVVDALGGGGEGGIVIPFVASCRDDDSLMGMCAQTQPLVIEALGNPFAARASHVQNAMLESISHWFVPQDITGRLPEYLFVFEDGGSELSSTGEQNYDLVVKFSDQGELIYNAARLPDRDAGRIASYLNAALRAAVQNRVSILCEDERELVSERFAHGRRLDAAYQTAAEAFSAAVRLHGGRTALETEDESLSYSAVWARANALAEALRSGGVGAGDVVAFHLPRTAGAIVAQIGIALSGAAFLPLDPAWPAERTDAILRDAGAAAILWDDRAMEFTGVRASVPPDTAYVVYTSGTTGRPKGVAVPQSALANQIAWAIDAFHFAPDDKMLHYIAFTFDPSIWVIFTALASGASLSLLPEGKRLDPDACARQITEQTITRCALPAAAAPEILRRVKASRLRSVFLGGEPIKHLPRERRTYETINLYGPTEACVNATFYRLPPGETETRVIGTPVANTSCYVLDQSETPCPVGVPGELFIGGAQLAHGYINRPEETAAAFAEHPQLGRLYKTGDRALWNPDGTLTFLGRRDTQVKIRGYRVELGEIEHALCEIPGVTDAKARYQDGVLDAFVVAAGTVDATALKKRLPGYMLPRSVTVLDAFPLTENGKIDVHALPAGEPAAECAEPLTERERAVAAAWRTALGLAPDYVIKRGDRFCDLGGHSLLLFHVVGLLSAKGYSADIRTLAEHPPLMELAQAIGGAKNEASPFSAKCCGESHARYYRYVGDLQETDLSEHRAFRSILITGGTGFLGSHLVWEFYKNTGAVLHLPVRGDGTRLRDALTYYFGGFGAEMFSSERVRVYPADISQRPPDIAAPLDAVFHTAADIRHYAPEAEMIRANVTATEHMLSLSQRIPQTLFAHISTTSAVNAPVIYETDTDLGPEFDNLYQRTKQRAERCVLDAGERGLPYAVFRVGHVSPSLESGSAARNWEINAMLRLISAMLLTGLLPEQDHPIGFGYVDQTARAIRLLSTPVNLVNHVFHLDNPNTLRLSEMFELAGLAGTVLPNAELTARLAELSGAGDAAVRQAASEYLGRLFQGRLEKDGTDIVAGKLFMDATLLLLKRLGFQWPQVTKAYLHRMVSSLENRAGGARE